VNVVNICTLPFLSNSFLSYLSSLHVCLSLKVFLSFFIGFPFPLLSLLPLERLISVASATVNRFFYLAKSGLCQSIFFSTLCKHSSSSVFFLLLFFLMLWLISPYWLKHEYFIWPDTCSILRPPKGANARVDLRESRDKKLSIHMF